MKPNVDYTLYFVTDRNCMSTRTVEESVENCIQGGCTLVQLREKNISSRLFFETAQKVRKITKQYGIPLLINDRVDIALAVDADGVHIGQSDLPANVVRKIIGPDKILGVSASTIEEAKKACFDNADYLGVGAMYATGTKSDAQITTMEQLAEIRALAKIPIVVIGGINQQTIPTFRSIGIDGFAVVSALIANPDIVQATSQIKSLIASIR